MQTLNLQYNIDLAYYASHFEVIISKFRLISLPMYC
jgi:hypothetical protein